MIDSEPTQVTNLKSAVLEIYAISKQGSQEDLPEIKPESITSLEVVKIIEESIGLPEGAAMLLRSKIRGGYPCDSFHVECIAIIAEDTRREAIDPITGLETFAVFKQGIAKDLSERYGLAMELTSEEIALPEAILNVLGHLTEEYTQHLQSELPELRSNINLLSFDNDDQRNEVTEKLIRKLLRSVMLLSYMSTKAVSIVDTRGMAAFNRWNEKHPRSDMGPQQTTDEIGMKKAGRTKQALSVYLGHPEYKNSLNALEGDQVKIWENEHLVEVVGPQYYTGRLTELTESGDLAHALREGLLYVGYRLRPRNGDEGIARIIKTKKDEDGRPICITDKDIEVMENLQIRASYVVAAEYSKEETSDILRKFNNAFGKHSLLSSYAGRLPVILVDRVGTVRLDKVFLETNITVAGNADEDEFTELVIKPIIQARINAENKMSENKLEEEMMLILRALNGDILAQIELAAMDKRFPVNPDELGTVLGSPEFREKEFFTIEDVKKIFQSTKLRKNDQKPE